MISAGLADTQMKLEIGITAGKEAVGLWMPVSTRDKAGGLICVNRPKRFVRDFYRIRLMLDNLAIETLSILPFAVSDCHVMVGMARTRQHQKEPSRRVGSLRTVLCRPPT
jgi:hypothetical protein